MQLLLLALLFGILAHDALLSPQATALAENELILVVLVLPKLALAGSFGLACVLVRRRLSLLRHLDRLTTIYRFATIALYAMDLCLGTLTLIRTELGDLVILDELALLSPTLALLVWGWWVYYPIDRRLREADLIHQIDSGLPVYPIWSRSQYVLDQIRHWMAVILVPALTMLAWVQLVVAYGPKPSESAPGTNPQSEPQFWLLGAGTVVIFLLVPLMICFILDTRRLPDGQIRQLLLHMCNHHRVRVRELLLWRTYGGTINAAVTGLIAPLRYILLTDGLLDLVSRDGVEAVMAHELAHVCKRHLFWLLAWAIGWLFLVILVFDHLAEFSSRLLIQMLPTTKFEDVLHWTTLPETSALAGIGTAILSWVIAFGWVSRRVERQADSFAVQHLASKHQPALTDEADRRLVDTDSVHTMVNALQQVADLNHIPATRRSWRHGSIRTRQAYLHSLIGQPIDALWIDRQMRWIQGTAVLAIGILVAMYWVQ